MEKLPFVVNARGENHIVEPCDLLDAQGHLQYPGYSFSLLQKYSRKAIATSDMRIKEWDYYLVNDEKFAVALTISDLGYLGMLSASVLNFEEKTFKTTSALTPFPLGSMELPESSEAGVSAFSNKRVNFRFEVVGDKRVLDATFKKFDGEEPLECHFVLDQIPRDTMVIATPYADDPKAFYYNQKIVGMRARGSFTKGDFTYEFDHDDSFGLLDWGRGVWTRDNVWYWGVAQGWQDGKGGNKPGPDSHVFGFNIGYGFGDTSKASENMVFVDGVAHKIGKLDFGVPKTDAYDTAKWQVERFRLMEPWHIQDEEGRFDLVFTPEIDRCDLTNVGVIITDQHQVFGVMNGFVVLDDGTKFLVQGLRAEAEVVRNKY